jgi:hypothetical protein
MAIALHNQQYTIDMYTKYRRFDDSANLKKVIHVIELFTFILRTNICV